MKEFKEDFLEPLRKRLQEEIEKLATPETKKQKKQRDQMAKMYGLPDVSDKDLEQYNQMSLTTLCI
jgi:hypothetical protein